jgi:phosphoribosylglycinamide formyltransferase-1
MYFKKRKKIVSFLVSGKGSNFKAVAEKIISGHIAAEIGIVISSSSDALALKKSEELGVQSIALEPKIFKSKEEHEAEIIKYLELHKTDLIVAAGYMRILTPDFIRIFRNQIINIHPSLLPAFPGRNAQQQALDYGVKITGCTTHFVDEGTDTGPIIMQSSIEINYSDDVNTLSNKILKEEHKILIESVKLFCEEKLLVKQNKVFIKD